MPNFDGGHYFLTALIPVRADLTHALRGAGGEQPPIASHVHALREILATLPTALQSPATEETGVNSPFARCRRTHFARFVLIDDVMFNGRDGEDSLAVALFRRNPTIPGPVDRLPMPYLLFAADFDAASDAPSELRDYLQGLWRLMHRELEQILQHCVGFDAKEGAAGFARTIARCQVETTMPFNDYWPQAPRLPSLSVPGLVAPIAVSAFVFLVGLVGAIAAGMMGARWGGWAVATLIGLVGIFAAAAVAYATILRRGAAPFPTAPDCDLPSVLKALYLQQRFARFAIDAQGRDAAALHALFGSFLETHKPEALTTPTQSSGVVRS
ncbi:MAG: hypothetical protein JO264_08710 [Acidisphaera sp.]|nr:hypothetical protein [Acidisphaera sp.]